MSFKPYKPRDYATTKEVVTRLIDAAGGVKQAAFLLERSPTQALAYSDPAVPDQISFDQVRHLVAATQASVPAEDLASLAGGVFLPAPDPRESFDMFVAEGAKDWGEFTAILLRAHATNKLPELQDRRAVLRRLDKLLHALASARSRLIADIAVESAEERG